MSNVLVIVGDPELDEVACQAALRGRFSTIVRHVLASWRVDWLYHPAAPSGPERWIAEMLAVGSIEVKERAFRKSQWEFCFARNSRLVNAMRAEVTQGGRALGLYFRGPRKGTKNSEDLAHKLSNAGARVILLSWSPDDELGPDVLNAVQETRDGTRNLSESV